MPEGHRPQKAAPLGFMRIRSRTLWLPLLLFLLLLLLLLLRCSPLQDGLRQG